MKLRKGDTSIGLPFISPTVSPFGTGGPGGKNLDMNGRQGCGRLLYLICCMDTHNALLYFCRVSPLGTSIRWVPRCQILFSLPIHHAHNLSTATHRQSKTKGLLSWQLGAGNHGDLVLLTGWQVLFLDFLVISWWWQIEPFLCSYNTHWVLLLLKVLFSAVAATEVISILCKADWSWTSIH